MLTVIIGGSGSGKSEYAENVATGYQDTNLIYLATMQPFGEETRKRIERHKKMRQEKQFTTIECYVNLDSITLPPKTSVLLECMSNLVANEMFSPDGAKNDTYERVKMELLYLASHADNVIIVTNQVFSDGITYDMETMNYLKALGKVNQWVSALADEVIQVIYGIPVVLKRRAYETMDQ